MGEQIKSRVQRATGVPTTLANLKNAVELDYKGITRLIYDPKKDAGGNRLEARARKLSCRTSYELVLD